MKNSTRAKLNAFTSHLASLNGVSSVSNTFTVAPSVAQTLLDRIRESAEFLNDINYVGVDELKGDKLFFDVARPIAGRVDTAATDRDPSEVHGLTRDGYECWETQFDAALNYSTLDTWAKFPDFQLRVRNGINAQIARDQLMIGWNGTSRAVTTNRATNTLLQDVNTGWLHKIRTHAPQRVLSSLKIGNQAGADFKNLDAAVQALTSTCIDDWHQTPALRVICGSALVDEKYLALTNGANTPTEIEALNNISLSKLIGGHLAKVVPYFKSRSLLLTPTKNLSIYTQTGSIRRFVVEQPQRSRMAFFNSMNTDYVVEDYGACALIDTILVPDGAGGWH